MIILGEVQMSNVTAKKLFSLFQIAIAGQICIEDGHYHTKSKSTAPTKQ